jgi:hypothetical protein
MGRLFLLCACTLFSVRVQRGEVVDTRWAYGDRRRQDELQLSNLFFVMKYLPRSLLEMQTNKTLRREQNCGLSTH